MTAPLQSDRRQVRWLTWFAWLGFVMPIAALAQTIASSSAPVVLPREAQEAVDKGVLAAKEQGYLLAIRYFQEARTIAPQAPEIYYDLGLAESRIPGRELRAIAWFGAYLAAKPDAPNAAVVKQEIDRLGIKSQINISSLIRTVQDAATQTGQNQQRALATVAELWAQSGDMTSAAKAVDQIPDPQVKVSALIGMADIQRNAGDSSGAHKTLESATGFANLVPHGQYSYSDDYRSEAYDRVAEAQANAGDIPGAQRTAALIQTAYLKCQAQIIIGQEQTKAGDMPGANQTLAAAEGACDLIETASIRGEDKIKLAFAKIMAGDSAGARLTLVIAKELADSLPSTSSVEASLKCNAQTDIFNLQARAGDLEGARQSLAGALKTLELVTDRDDKRRCEWGLKSDRSGTIGAVVERRLEVGDIAGAQQYADLIQDADTRGYVQKSIVAAQARAGDIEGAQRTADLIRNDEQKGDAQRVIADAKAKSRSTSSPAITVSSTIAAHASVQPVVPAIAVSAWISKLDDKSWYDECPLGTDPFLDLAGYLKSSPSSDDPGRVFDALRTTAEKLIKAQNIIGQMLKQQGERTGTS